MLLPLGWVVAILALGPSISIIVTNQGPTAMQSVTVLAGAKSVAIGDIPVGATRTARIRPAGDSGVEIRFTNSSGLPSTLITGPYITGNFGGDVKLTIANDKVVGMTTTVGPRLY